MIRLRLKVEDYLTVPVWIAIAVFAVFANDYSASIWASYIFNIPMALGLALLWGFAGVLSFGQVAFFGLSGYAYGVIAGNLGESAALASWIGAGGALALSVALALAVGWFVFYSRVEAWIVPIVTLVISLILAAFLGQTAGYQWRIGEVHLGGYNGMTGIPGMNLFGIDLQGRLFLFFVIFVAVLAWLVCVICTRSRYGDSLIALREDAVRTELFGHDIRFLQTSCFMISAALAGLSGVLYVQWGSYITPDSMGLLQATLPVIWVAVGGRSSLLGVILSTLALNALTYQLSSAGNQYAFVILGVLLVVVMVIPTTRAGKALSAKWRRLTHNFSEG
ncbi:branched-chain amino acid ABC transporter permease [Castellaniella sp.]|uniref:branched-chain amino acid ABC transporter permease n=1 Tax=Castellaniella sp. TaxID=1955812 RepID=UPI003C7668B4